MTDRELLEAAAKAAGIVGIYGPWWDNGTYSYRGPDCGIEVWDDNRTERYLWNPLIDDGDALRLAVKLRIAIWHESEQDERWVVAEARGTGTNECIDHGQDYGAATRRAIVRAAAAMAQEQT